MGAAKILNIYARNNPGEHDEAFGTPQRSSVLPNGSSPHGKIISPPETGI
jgi:hypothetical protein